MSEPLINASENQPSDLRAFWLDYFLACAREVAPNFRIGEPKMSYRRVQTGNGKRNAASLRHKGPSVEIAFTLHRNSQFEELLKTAGFRSDYVLGKHRQLFTEVNVTPETKLNINTVGYSTYGDFLRPMMLQAAQEALPAAQSKRPKKLAVLR